MKPFLFILSTYLLALLVIPCSDNGGGFAGMWNNWLGIEHESEHHHDEHSNSCEDDHCSPFCVCSCCSIVLDSPEKMPLHVEWATVIHEELPTFKPQFIPSTFMPSIWQPPRFS